MMKKILYMTVALIFSVSCGKMLPDKFDIVRLGIAQDTVIAPARQVRIGAKVLSDRDYELTIETETPWLEVISATSDTLIFSLAENDGFRRSAVVRIGAAGREDKLRVCQEGKWKESVRLSESEVISPAAGMKVSARVISNLPSDCLKASTLDTRAISNLTLNDYILSFDVLPTTNRDSKLFTVKVYCTDGWEEEASAQITVRQEAYE